MMCSACGRRTRTLDGVSLKYAYANNGRPNCVNNRRPLNEVIHLDFKKMEVLCSTSIALARIYKKVFEGTTATLTRYSP